MIFRKRSASDISLKLSQLSSENTSLRYEVASRSAKQSPFFHYNSSFDAIELMRRHALADVKPHPDYVTNFLGVKVSPKYFPGLLNGKEGSVEPIPIPANWHADIAEWAGVLRAVDTASKVFRIVELGCGWGCWLNNAGAAARRRGLKVELIGIEGDRSHVGFAHEALAANGFSPDEYRVIHGVASPRRSKALFPITERPSLSWGLEPIFEASEAQIADAQRNGKYEVLDALPLPDIAEDDPIDLLHIDIQGSEADFIQVNFSDIDRLVRHILVGTHSRIIEGEIISFLMENGWALEIERPCIFALEQGLPAIRVDGVQGWRNPYFKS